MPCIVTLLWSRVLKKIHAIVGWLCKGWCHSLGATQQARVPALLRQLILWELGLVLFHDSRLIPAPVSLLQRRPFVVFLLAGSQCDFTFYLV